MATAVAIKPDPNKAILDSLGDLASRFATVEKRMGDIEEKAAKPLFSPNHLFHATTGPVGRDSAGYSILKAAAFSMGYLGKEQCKEEFETHLRLKELYRESGRPSSMWEYGNAAFLVPYSTLHMPQESSVGVSLAREIRQKMLGSVQGYDPDYANWIRQKALGTTSDIAGGVLVGFPTLGEMIDLQRNMEVFTEAGATDMSLPANARIQFPKLTGGSTAYWVGEAAAITESQQSTGSLSLEGKKLGILTKLNNELLRYASPSAEGMVRNDMARVAALKADLAMLEGTGGTQIKGLIRYDSYANWTPNTDKLITYTVTANVFQPEDVTKMIGKLPDAVQKQKKTWLFRNELWGAVASRRADAVTPADGAGPFVFNLTRNTQDEIQENLGGYKVVKSSQISATRGSGGNQTYVVVGSFQDWIIGRFGVMEFLATNLGDTAFQNDQTWLRGIQILDAGPRHSASFVFADEVNIA